jgi:hypothetical protein
MSEEKNRPNTIPMMAGFDALQEALKPLVELIRFVSKPETGIAIRQTLEDLERHWREEDRSFINFTVTHRWLGLERHMTSEQLRLLIRVSEANGPAVANQMVPKVFRPEKIEEMVTPWSTIPYLRARSPVIADATAAYRSGMYSLVIPALLPLAEGLEYEAVGGGRQKYDAVQRAARAQKDQVSADDQLWFDAMMKFLDDVYSWMEFGLTGPAGSFHRGLIIHGRSPDYATAENAARSFLLLDTVTGFYQLGSRPPLS